MEIQKDDKTKTSLFHGDWCSDFYLLLKMCIKYFYCEILNPLLFLISINEGVQHIMTANIETLLIFNNILNNFSLLIVLIPSGSHVTCLNQ